MSKLNDQFKEIQTKLLKAEFFKLAKESLSKIDSGSKFKDVAKEVKDQVNAFIDAQIDIIESGDVKEAEIASLFTSDEVATLKLLAARAGKKVVKGQEPPAKQEPKRQREPIDTPDKISFALQHRNLGGKRVQIKDKGSGACVGLDAPYVVVKLDNGTTVEVLPQELIV